MAHFNLEDYETVEERLIKFWKEHPNGRIETQLVEHTPSRFIVNARIFREQGDSQYWASGYAYENVSDRGVNSTSALENCETSAIGRALANAGFATKGKRASREEMTKVKAKADTQALIEQTKAKMAQTSGEYVPVPKEDDPWTIRDAQPAATVDEAVKIVESIMGKTNEAPRCSGCHDHKPMEWKSGQGKNNKPYGKYSCWVCKDVIWYEIAKDGSWQPQKKYGA